MLLDGYAEVNIEAVVPGAELEDVVYDQWAPLLGVLSFLLFSRLRRGPGVPSPVL